jgi:ankyrin repeat protein
VLHRILLIAWNLTYLQKLFIDARDGRIDSVRKGLKAADVDVNIPDPTVAAPAMMMYDAVKVTLVHIVMNNTQTGQTALCVACMNNMVEVVKLLLKKKILLDVQDKVTGVLRAASFKR